MFSNLGPFGNAIASILAVVVFAIVINFLTNPSRFCKDCKGKCDINGNADGEES